MYALMLQLLRGRVVHRAGSICLPRKISFLQRIKRCSKLVPLLPHYTQHHGEYCAVERSREAWETERKSSRSDRPPCRIPRRLARCCRPPDAVVPHRQARACLLQALFSTRRRSHFLRLVWVSDHWCADQTGGECMHAYELVNHSYILIHQRGTIVLVHHLARTPPTGIWCDSTRIAAFDCSQR